jgi:hypothetical protein
MISQANMSQKNTNRSINMDSSSNINTYANDKANMISQANMSQKNTNKGSITIDEWHQQRLRDPVYAGACAEFEAFEKYYMNLPVEDIEYAYLREPNEESLVQKIKANRQKMFDSNFRHPKYCQALDDVDIN